jgi:hypothetical protein
VNMNWPLVGFLLLWTFLVRLVVETKNPLEPSGPVQASDGIALPFYIAAHIASDPRTCTQEVLLS